MPDAVRAGASYYVSRLLARDRTVYEEIPDWQQKYPVWLAILDAFCRQHHGVPLTDLSPQQAEAVVAGLDAGSLASLDSAVDQKLAFKTFYRHCIQGCFADPRWGGNRDRVMWRWIGYLQQPEEVRQP